MPQIPSVCLALWRQLKRGAVDVHEQELSKASDIKQLFDLGLVRMAQPQTKLLPSVSLVLSEYGEEVRRAELNN